jgi:type III restriction enzyme
VCKKVSGNLNVKNNADKKKIHLNKNVYLSPDFEELWDRMKFKTTYAVKFDSDVLIEKCCEELKKSLIISSAKLVYTKAKVDVTAGGVVTKETNRATVLTTNVQEALPDIIAYLQNRTNLTRKTIVAILIKSKSLHLFAKNPQRYMEDVAQTMITEMRTLLVDGIKYTKIGDAEYYAQELFETEELFGYLERNMIASEKSVYDHVVYDSINEENFSTSFENNAGVKLYAKLPDWFKIPTPLGTYNPDWAVVVEQEEHDKLYFVIETKGNVLSDALRPTETKKIICGRKHFEALGEDVDFKAVDDFNGFIESV